MLAKAFISQKLLSQHAFFCQVMWLVLIVHVEGTAAHLSLTLARGLVLLLFLLAAAEGDGARL